jgi:hypothetical protein
MRDHTIGRIWRGKSFLSSPVSPLQKEHSCPSHRKNIEMVGLNIKIEMRGRRKDFISSPEDGAKKKQKEYRFLNVSFHSIKS